LMYARLAGLSTDLLIDDEYDLPEKLPAIPKGAGVKRRSTASRT
jgi:hypothetical protein